MTRVPGRRRAALLLALALASGGLAASEVRGRISEVEQRTGRPVPVVVAAADIPPGAVIDPGGGLLEVRRVPAAYAPPDALADPADAAGRRVAAALPRGSYLTATALATGQEEQPAENAPGPALPRGERAVELRVAGGAGPAAGLAPGARVDVLVTAEGDAGGGRTYVALEDVELLDMRAGGPADEAAEGGAPAALATLRVPAAEAAFLVAAQAFAREVRLLARPPGDRRPLRGDPVTRGDL